MEKITYASLGSLGADFHAAFDQALRRVEGRLGAAHPMFIQGKPVKSGRKFFSDSSPADTRMVLGQFPAGTRADAEKAIRAARVAFPGWRATDWRQRVALIRRAAALMSERQFDLAALLCLEVGKNRFEAIAEVSESVDLLLYYSQQMEDHSGYEIPLVTTGKERTRSLLKPYGVWAVVSPFNFPLALAAGMAAGALVSGNTAVFKPASDTPYSGLTLYEIFRDCGLPPGVFNFVTGRGGTLGDALVRSPDVDGFIFTGSKPVGLKILHTFARKNPRPCITEMGGKNPALIMPSANLEDAAEGVMRSAFGMGGQKCSACSRAYVHRDIYDAFRKLLLEKSSRIKIGNPAEPDVFLGPLINGSAVARYQRAIALGRREGRIALGGGTLKEEAFKHGFFVEPTIVEKAPASSALFREEYFAPVLALKSVGSLDEAIRLANDGEYGLTAGIFTAEEKEWEKFFGQIEAGVTYCNRRGGATTGAWPGVQSFGGWKNSGSSGKSALGPHYVAQFMREQSQTVIQ